MLILLRMSGPLPYPSSLPGDSENLHWKQNTTLAPRIDQVPRILIIWEDDKVKSLRSTLSRPPHSSPKRTAHQPALNHMIPPPNLCPHPLLCTCFMEGFPSCCYFHTCLPILPDTLCQIQVTFLICHSTIPALSSPLITFLEVCL